MALILSYANDITTRLMAREEPARYGSHPIRTRLTGHELGNTNDPRELRRLAREYAQRHFRRGLTVTNTETGWRICIAVRGVKHAISYHGIRPDIARSVPGLPSLVEGSTLGGSVQGDKEGEHTVHRFHGRLYIDTYLYEATILVKEDSQGKFYYDHRLTRVEPAAHPGEPMAEDTSHRFEPTTQTGSISNLTINLAGVHEIRPSDESSTLITLHIPISPRCPSDLHRDREIPVGWPMTLGLHRLALHSSDAALSVQVRPASPLVSRISRLVAENWSLEEVVAIVADYFDMLNLELRGEHYNKRDHNRRLQNILRDRSPGAIEFKHANISAVLNYELDFPYIPGYKPRRNYQELLRDEVASRLENDPEIVQAARLIVDASPAPRTTTPSPEDVFVEPPSLGRSNTGRETPTIAPIAPRNVNYLEREAHNAQLGEAGELFVMAVEHQRLWKAGNRRLAERIEHVSRTQGDGLGYDIASFEEDGRERLIEVKTTNFGSMTPFFASRREVDVSEARSREYHLYRVFEYRESPRIFSLAGPIRQSFILDATQYRASFL